jgi:ADP-ribose pyrophosphatase YjhB (NUDIX family)
MKLDQRRKAGLFRRLTRLFGNPACALQAAALPWRPAGDGVEILLVTSRGTGRWVLPKGWPKRKEFPHEAAAREAGRYFYLKADDEKGDRHCEVLVFPLRVDREDDEWAEKDQRDRRWMTAAEAASAVAEPELATLVSEFGSSAMRE